MALPDTGGGEDRDGRCDGGHLEPSGRVEGTSTGGDGFGKESFNLETMETC